MAQETENQVRLRRAKDALSEAIEKESEARQALRRAEESRKLLKEKYEAIFLQEEQEEVRRRKNEYRHCTL